MKILFLSCIIVFSFSTFVFSDDFEIGKCYPINGPANIRTKPSGEIQTELPNGKTVRIVSKNKSGWYLIEYSKYPYHNACPPQGEDYDLKHGWTFKNNLAIGMPLSDLVKKGKVTRAANLEYREVIDYIDDKTVAAQFAKLSEGIDVGIPLTVKLKKPMKVNVYSLNGAIQHNEIVSIRCIPDAGVSYAYFNMKNELPEGFCILVNGYINDFNKKNRVSSSNEFKQNYKRELHVDSMMVESGDFNNDGIFEMIVLSIVTTTVSGICS